jgi:hypothetical protein
MPVGVVTRRLVTAFVLLLASWWPLRVWFKQHHANVSAPTLVLRAPPVPGGRRHQSPCAVGCASPSPWVLRAQFPTISVYLDSGWVDRHRSDSAVAVWLMWVNAVPIRAGSGRNAGLVKNIEVNAAVRCWQGADRALHLNFYDPSGAQVLAHDFVPADTLQPAYALMIHNVLPAICSWLKDPTSPPAVVQPGRTSMEKSS